MKQKFIYLDNNNINSFYKVFSSSILNLEDINTYDLNSFKEMLKLNNIINQNSFLFGNDEPIGLFLSTKKSTGSYISALGVVKKYRQKGYGRIILQKGLSLLFENNCKTVVLEVIKSNENAIKLYTSEGFKITNEINNFRNENNSFYTKLVPSNFHIKKVDSYTFNFIYNNFNKTEKPWQKKLNSIIQKINCLNCEIYYIQHKNITKGYAVISYRDNYLNIHDIYLNKEAHHTFGYFISSLLKNEKIVQANSFYSDDSICSVIKKNGFFIDRAQYEMKKELR